MVHLREYRRAILISTNANFTDSTNYPLSTSSLISVRYVHPRISCWLTRLVGWQVEVRDMMEWAQISLLSEPYLVILGVGEITTLRNLSHAGLATGLASNG